MSTKCFKSADFSAGPKVLTIAAIETEKVAGHGRATITKRIVRFKESACGSSLTRRKARLLDELFGTGPKNAIGQRIELFRGVGIFKGKNTPYVCFRAPRRTAAN